MIRVAVAGASGRMGQSVCATVVAADDMELVCGIDPHPLKGGDFPIYATVEEALACHEVDVLVDFTQKDAAEATLACALSHGIDCVLGTTGIPEEVLEHLVGESPEGTSLFYAPNFTTGAVLMMQFARAAAPYFPEAEVIEFHHCRKKDAPSGTAVMTAKAIAEGRGGAPSAAPGSETEIEGAQGARGALIEGVPVHSVRSDGFVANQEVIFGGMGQTLSIKHVSWDTLSYMPGVLLGIRESAHLSGLVSGLENIMAL